MARAPISGRGSAGGNRNRIIISAPEGNATVNYNSAAGRTFVFDFDTSKASFSRAGNNLTITLDNGAVVNLVDYFAVGDRPLPNFELMDGAVVAGSDYLQAQSPNLDLKTAAGPAGAPRSPQGGGVGEYRDGFGKLIDSVDRLGDQEGDPFHWGTPRPGLDERDTIGAFDISIVDPVASGLLVDEAGLRNGTNPGVGMISKWIQFTLGDGVSIVGVPAGGSGTFQGPHGILTIRHLGGSSYECSYELTSPNTSTTGNDGRNIDVDVDVITFEITSPFGSGTARIAVDIKDDAPLVVVGQGTGPGDGPVLSGYDVTGEWSVNYGADGKAPGSGLALRFVDAKGAEQVLAVVVDQPVEIKIGGTVYGTFTLKSDGTYVFSLKPNLTGKISAFLGALDGDGDFSQNPGALFTIVKPGDPSGPLGKDAWFDETHLPDGTLPDGTQLTKSILLPQGFAIDLSANPWAKVTDANGNVYYKLATNYGELRYTPAGVDPATGDYLAPRLTYTLVKNASHGAQGEADDLFWDKTGGKVTLIDAGGNTWAVDTQFRIFDDEPVVLLEGAKGDSVHSGYDFLGTWSTVFGADSMATSNPRELIVKVNGKEGAFAVTVGQPITLTIDGVTYGTITFKQGGDFVFTPRTNLTADLDFTLRGTDADGDAASASLKVHVTPPDGPGDWLYPDDPNPVRESGLPDGSSPKNGDVVRVISVPDGYTVDTSDPNWKDQGNGKYVWTPAGKDPASELTYDPGTNKLTYTLKDGKDHPLDKDGIFDELDGITLKDDKGNTFDGRGVAVEVLDDVPQGEFTGNDNSGKPGESIFGGLDVDFGGDGPHATKPLDVIITNGNGDKITIPVNPVPSAPVTTTTPVTFGGKDYGDITITVTPDGKIDFKLEIDKNADPIDLDITAEVQDKDGDKITTDPFPISILDPNGPGVNHLAGSASESFLPEGTAYNNGAGLTQPVALPSGYTVDVSKGGWQPGAGGTFVLKGAYGELHCNAAGTELTYTLTKNAGHPDGQGANTVFDKIDGVVIKDGSGKEFTLPAKIAVVDDVPVTSISQGAQGNTIASGQSYEGVWSADFGADGKATAKSLQLEVSVDGKKALLDISATGPTAVVVDGKNYGQITFNEQTHKYVFNSAPNTEGRISFGLVVTDKDGDVARAAQYAVINVKPAQDPGALGDGVTLEEANLAKGSDPKPAELTKEITLPQGCTVDVSKDGWIRQGTSQEYRLDNGDGVGHLTYNTATNKLSYTLDAPGTHTAQGSDELQDSFPKITITDPAGNNFERAVVINVSDDMPEAALGGAANAQVETGKTFSGTWDADFGADGPAQTGSLVLTITRPGQAPVQIPVDPANLPTNQPVIIDGKNYGSLTLTPDGKYSFTATPNGPTGQLELVLSAKDGDGDVSKSAVFKITVVPPGGFSVLTAAEPFYEANFQNGTDPNVNALTKLLNLPAGYKVVVDAPGSGWQMEYGTSRYFLDNVQNSGYGKLVYDTATGKLTYTLTGRVQNAVDSDMGQDVVKNILVKDASGNTFTVDAVVDIKDDKPELSFGGKGDVESGKPYTGQWDYQFGADGAAQTKAIVVDVQDKAGHTQSYTVAVGSDTEIAVNGVRYGSLTLKSDGTFVFNAASDVIGTLEFSVTITDRDGDSVKSPTPFTLKITPGGVDPIIIGDGPGEWVTEAALPGGTGVGSAPLTKEIKLPTINKGAEECTPDLAGWKDEGNGIYSKAGAAGHLTWNSISGKLYYTLDKATSHGKPDAQGAGDVANDPGFTTLNFKDSDGNSYSVKCEFQIRDDAPLVTFDKADPGKVDYKPGESFDGTWKCALGADGKAAADYQVLTVTDGTNTYTIKDGALKFDGTPMAVGNYGTLSLKSDGTFTFQINNNVKGSLTFTLAGKDGDADARQDSFPINIDDLVWPSEIGKGTFFSEANLTVDAAAGQQYAGTSADATQLEKPIDLKTYLIDTTQSGWVLDNALGGYRLDGDNGYLLYKETTAGGKTTGSLSYKLLHSGEHAKPGEIGDKDTALDGFTKSGTPGEIVLKDANGNTKAIPLVITVQDDGPLLYNFERAPGSQDNYSAVPIDGTYSLTYGADGPADANPLVLNYSINGGAVQSLVIAKLGTVYTIGSGANTATIVFNADNTFRFVSAPDLDKVKFSLSLRVTDHDGDSQSKSLGDFTIDKKPVDFPKITCEKIEEADLPNGTSPDPTALTKTLTLTPGYTVVTTKDGWTDLGGGKFEKVVPNGKLLYDGTTLKYEFTTPLDHPGAGQDTGNVDFGAVTFTVSDSYGNTYVVGKDPNCDVKVELPVVDDMPVVSHELTGTGAGVKGGESVSGKLDLNYGADDAAALADKPLQLKVTLDGTTYTFDIAADGKPVALNLGGTNYGTLTLKADNTYTYTAANNVPTDKTLGFSFQAKDGDGDITLSNVKTIQTLDPNAPVPVDDAASYYEKNLQGGSAPDPDALSHKIVMPAGYVIDTDRGGWQGNAASGFTLENADGSARLTYKNGELTCELLKPLTHADGLGANNKDYAFTIYEEDSLGNDLAGATTLTIHVVDDVPSASFTGSASGNTVTSGQIYTGSWAAPYGADGPAATPDKLQLIVSKGADTATLDMEVGVPSTITIKGVTYGQITLKPGGGYEFKAAPDTGGTDLSFVLSVMDADKDNAKSAPFVIKVDSPQGPATDVLHSDGAVDEAKLTNGTQPGNDASRTVNIIMPPSEYTLDTSVGGWKAGAGNTYTLAMQNGTLTYNATAKTMTYTLTKVYDHTAPASGAERNIGHDLLNKALTFKDADGNTFKLSVDAAIQDDIPLVNLTGAGSVIAGNACTGTWSALYGADGRAGGAAGDSYSFEVLIGAKTIVAPKDIKAGDSVVVKDGATTYGTFTLNADGTFNFAAANNVKADLVLKMSLVDSDGDTVTATHNLQVKEAGAPDLPDPSKTLLDEANLSNGTDPNAAALVKYLINSNDPNDINRGFTVDLTQGGWTKSNDVYILGNTTSGRLVCDLDGKNLRYELVNNFIHDAPNAGITTDEKLLDGYTITLKDAKNNTFTVTAGVTVVDDEPKIDFSDADGYVTSGLPYTGSYTLQFGADGSATPDASKNISPLLADITTDKGVAKQFAMGPGSATDIVIDGVNYGKLTLSAGNQFTFVANPNVKGTLDIKVTVTDKDLDQAHSDVFKLHINEAVGPPPGPLSGWFDEANLTGGTAADASQATKDLDITKFQGFTVDTSTGTGWVSGGTNADGEQFWTLRNADPTGQYGTLTYYLKGGNQRMTYTLEKTATHSDPAKSGVDDSFVSTVGNIIWKDAANNTWARGTEFAIYDDAPQVKFGLASSTAVCGYVVEGGVWSTAFGADLAASTAPRTISIVVTDKDGNAHTISGKTIVPGAEFAIVDDQGKDWGKLTLLTNGQVRFRSAANLEDTSFTFTLTAKDGDGDIVSTKPVTITVDTTLPPDPVTAPQTYDEGNLPGGTSPNNGLLTQILTLPADYTVDTSAGTGWTSAGAGVWTKADPNGYGTLKFTAAGNKLEYTLTSAPKEVGTGENVFDNDFSLKLKHIATGNTHDVPVLLDVRDDIPEVTLAGATPGMVTVQTGTEYKDGNWQILFGADGPAANDSLVLTVNLLGTGQSFSTTINAASSSTAIVIGGKTYGTLTLNADKTFSFKAGNNVDGELSFTLTATDGDKDSVQSGKFEVKVISKPGPVGDLTQTFDEANFSNGTDPKPADLSKVVDLPAGYKLAVGAADTANFWSKMANPETIDGVKYEYNHTSTYGTFQVSADGKHMRYTLATPVNNPKTGGSTYLNDTDATDYIPSIKILSDNGDEFSIAAKMKILDDDPQLTFTAPGAVEIPSGGEYTSPGGGYLAQFGADGSPAVGAVQLSVTIGGVAGQSVSLSANGSAAIKDAAGKEYGTLTLNSNGTFTFKANPGIGDTDISLSMVITDKDGDTAQSANPLSIKITEWEPAATVQENDLPAGTSPDAAGLTKILALPAGYTPDTTGWTPGAGGVFTKAGTYGTLKWDGTQLTYTLTKAAANDAPGMANDTYVDDKIQVTLKDGASGAVLTVDMGVRVEDDVPVITGGTDATLSGGPNNGFDFTSSAAFTPDFGADGPDMVSGKYHFTLEYTSTGTLPTALVSKNVELPANGDIVTVTTSYGKIELNWNSTTKKVDYIYTALQGRKGDEENFALRVYDGDKDTDKTPNTLTITLDDDVPDVILHLEEGGLSYGSGQLPAHGDATDTHTMTMTYFKPATSLVWDLADMANLSLKADSDRDGNYETVTWRQVGNDLEGIANGVVVIKLVADFSGPGNTFTGKMTATLSAAFQHGAPGSDGDSVLNFDLNFDQMLNGTGYKGVAGIELGDDTPRTDSQGQGMVAEALESGQRLEDVYLVLDMSNSMGTTPDSLTQSWCEQIRAVRALAQAYVDNGITCRFSVITFKTTAGMVSSLEGVTPEELLALLQADATGYSLLSTEMDLIGDTNYTNPLTLLQQTIDASMTRNETKGMQKTVYFVTDGTQEGGDPPINTYWKQGYWTPYMEAHRDLITTYAIGVGDNFSKASGNLDALEHIAGDPNRVFRLDDFTKLADQLVALIKPVEGNLLTGIASADVTEVLSVTILLEGVYKTFMLDQMDQDTHQKCTQAITLPVVAQGNAAATLTVYADGSYKLSSANIDEDFSTTLTLQLKDADGDVRTSPSITLKILDSVPVAYDNMQYADSYSEYTELAAKMNAATDLQGWLVSRGRFTSTLAPSQKTLPWDNTEINGQRATDYIWQNYGKDVHAEYDGQGWVSMQASMSNNLGTLLNMTGTATEQDFLNFMADPKLQITHINSRVSAGVTQYDVAMLGKTFEASGGQVVVGWGVTGMFADPLPDGTFWVLLDADNNRLDWGKLVKSAIDPATGLLVVDLPDAPNGRYTIVIGLTQGKVDVSQELHALHLNTALLLEPEYTYRGNVIYDPSPEGRFDQIFDQAQLLSVEYKGTVYTFGAKTSLEIAADSGTLFIGRDGSYSFASNGNPSAGEEFTYKLVDRDGDESGPATLYLGTGTAPAVVQAYDNIAAWKGYTTTLLDDFAIDATYTYIPGGATNPENAQPTQDTLNLRQKLPAGWTQMSTGGSSKVTTGEILPIEDKAAPTDTRLEPYTDSYMLKIAGATELSASQVATLFGAGVDTKPELAGVLREMGLDVAADGSDLAGTLMRGSVAAKTFKSSGGDIILDFSFGGKQAGSAAEDDGAFYVVKNSKGETVARGTLAQLENGAASEALVSQAGVKVFSLPKTQGEESYTLYLGSVQVGSGEGNLPDLYINSIAQQKAEYKFSGNLLTNPDPGGRVDITVPGTEVRSVSYEGVEHTFTGTNTSLTINADNGTLTVYKDGTYEFLTASGDLATVKGLHEDFTYTIGSGDKTSSAHLYVRGEDLQFQYTSAADNRDHSSHTAPEYINGGLGNDSITGGSGGNVIHGGAGDDTLIAGNSGDSIHGGFGNDYIKGGVGADLLYGDEGDDTILGGAGNDVIYGGRGINTLTGGSGADSFGWAYEDLRSGSKTTITDFSTAENDRLLFKDLLTVDDVAGGDMNKALDTFFKAHITNVQANANAHTLSFSIQDNALSHDVTLTFNSTDAAYNKAVADYSLGDQEALTNFLLSISTS